MLWLLRRRVRFLDYAISKAWYFSWETSRGSLTLNKLIILAPFAEDNPTMPQWLLSYMDKPSQVTAAIVLMYQY